MLHKTILYVKLQSKRFFAKSIQAFSLLEVSIALCVMGLLLSYAIPSYFNILKVGKSRDSERKLDALCYVLASFAKNNGILPCAAQSPLSGNQTSNTTGRSVSGLQKGIVPYVTLGISESDAKDGFGRWITYAVAKSGSTSPRLSSAIQFNERGRSSASFCDLKPIMDVDNPLIINTPHSIMTEKNINSKDFLAFVLISHGATGVMTSSNDSDNSVSPSREKMVNASASMVLYDWPQSTTFDDKVRWVTRNNLMAMYAKSPCDIH